MDQSRHYYYYSERPPSNNLPPEGDFIPPTAQNPEPQHGSWHVYHQPPPPGPDESWSLCPPVPPAPISAPPPSFLPFDPSRPPPRFFSSSPCVQLGGPADLRPSYQIGVQNIRSQQHPPAYPGFPADPQHKPNQPSDVRGSGDVTAVSHQTPVADLDAVQRKQDETWIRTFLHERGKVGPSARPWAPVVKQTVCEFREKLLDSLELISELSALSLTLKQNLQNRDSWTEPYCRAMTLRSRLEDSMRYLTDPDRGATLRRRLTQIKKRRERLHRRRVQRREEKREQEVRTAEKEAAIDKHQLKKTLELEEKNRERELKLAADSVLAEVRRKQGDTKRMLDILKALEKLRKLRKDAASRKGLFPEKECDAVFEGHLLRLRALISKRTAVYGAEEKALRVMLEGEQEEERKRDHEKRQRKEQEKQLQKKREVDAMLFGAELPSDHPLQPYLEYYTSAEYSLPALVQIRREWDQFLVPADHPKGSSVPRGWVLPDPPADDLWASALQK